MRFFSFDWWAGECQDAGVIDAYWAHVDALGSALPEAVRSFTRHETLHDSNLRFLKADLASGTIAARLEGSDMHLGERRIFELLYGGVSSLELLGEHDEPLGGPGSLGDLGYDEWDVADGSLEHRMLFSTGIEIRIRCATFAYAAASES